MEYKFDIDIPLKVVLYTRKKDNKDVCFRCNLNEYRNKHYRVLNNAKHIYHEIIINLLKEKGIKLKLKKIHTKYELWKPNKRKIDFRNVLSIVDKFFMDALVEYGMIIDDNTDYYQSADDRYGGIDPKGEGFVRVYIYGE